MKKQITIIALATSLFLSVSNIALSAELAVIKNDKTKAAVELVSNQSKAQMLMTRLQVIENIDKSVLSAAEKRKLRKEVRQINTQLRELSGGVYLSAGAVIIILLLLIILI